MAEKTAEGPNRLERRKARTRAALVRAAQACMASGQVNVPILELTQAADVGLGSFYNHFACKEELFRAALEDALDAYGDLLDQLTIGLDDPAEVFAQSFRLTGRLHRRQPQRARSCCTTRWPSSAPPGASPRVPAATWTPRPAPEGSPSSTPSWP